MLSTEGDSSRDIAIVGLSCRFAGDAKDVHGYWELLRKGKSAFSPRARFDDAASSYHGYYLQDHVYKFDSAFFGISPKEAKAMDPSQRLMMEVAYEAFESAGLTLETIAGSNTCVYAAQWACDYRDMLAQNSQQAPTYTATGTGTTMLSNRLSWFFDLRGPSMTINTACSSSMVALHEACESLHRGESDMALVASANLILCPDMFTYLGMQNFLSTSGKCKSFDATGDGYGRGEGIAALVLKRVPTAMEDQCPIRAVIRGTGVNQNGRMKGITLPSIDAQVALMKRTYQSAGLAVTETAYVEAHGTGTKAGDPVELEAIGKAIAQPTGSQHGRKVIVGSGKPNIGHTEASAGLASVIKSVLVLESGLIPPNIYLTQLNPNLRLDEWNLEIPTQLTPWPSECDFRRISVCSTGYGGANAHAIIDESHHYLRRKGLVDRTRIERPPVWAAAKLGVGQQVQISDTTGSDSSPPRHFLLTFSSDNEKGTQNQLASLGQWCAAVEEAESANILADLAYTFNQRRSNFAWRTSITVSSVSELRLGAEGAEKGTASHSRRMLDNAGLCFIFTGQGGQWPRMGQALYFASRTFRASIDAAERYFRDVLKCPWSVVDELFREESKSCIDQHVFSQPLTTVLQMGLADLLQEWNVQPDWIIGHSSGEIAGAYCLGALTQQDAWKIAYSCGAFSSEQEGSMMAVGLSETEANSIIGQHALGEVVVACINSPINVTLAGDNISLDRLEKLLHSRGVFAQRLRVDAAYHSSHIEAMTTNYGDAISQVVPTESIQCRTMFSSVTGKEIHAQDFVSTYWVKNLVSKVRFSDAVSNLLTTFPARDKVFVEIGPHQTMQAPLKQIFTNCSGFGTSEYVSILSRGKDSAATAYTAAGQLWAIGVPVDTAKLNETGRQPSLIVDLPPYPWRHKDVFNAIAPTVGQKSHETAKTDRQSRDICFSLDWQPAPELSTEVANEEVCVTLLLPRRPTQTLRALSGLITQCLRSSGFNVELAAWPTVDQATDGCKCISLVELDAPIFDKASAEDFAALQKIVSDSKSILWLSLNTPAGSIVPGLAATIRSEIPGLQFRTLQVTSPYLSRIADLGKLVASLAASNTQDMEFRELQGTLSVPRVNEDAAIDEVLRRFLPQQPLDTSGGLEKPTHQLQPDATYILAGGLGGLGRNIANFLVDLGARHICFLSRSSTATASTESFLTELRKRQVFVSAYECDVSDMRSLRVALQQCRQEHPPIKGIIQCAMVLRDVSFHKMSHSQWQETLRPKVQGSANLAATMEPRHQPFFIMLSSFTAIFGNRTQANYVAACAFQDALAHDLHARGLHAVALDLGIMRDVGYLAQHGSVGALKSWEQDFGLRGYEMRALLHAAMAKQTPSQVITGLPTATAASAAGLDRPFFLDNPKFAALAFTGHGHKADEKHPTTSARLTAPSLSHLDRTAPDSKDQISRAFRAAVATALHMSDGDVVLTHVLHALGTDSLSVIEVQSWLFRALGVRLSADELMADVPLSRLVERVWEKWRGGDGKLR